MPREAVPFWLSSLEAGRDASAGLFVKHNNPEPKPISFRAWTHSPTKGRIPSAASIHAVRRSARRILVRIRVLEHVYGRSAFCNLVASLRELVRITGESRDAEVHCRLMAVLIQAPSKVGQGECDRLVARLRGRRRTATLMLARSLHSRSWTEQLRRLNIELSALRGAQSLVDFPRMASRRYRRTLGHIEKQLGRKLTADRVHLVRKKVRRARDLASMLDPPRDARAVQLRHRLDAMQGALGELHDGMLFADWVREGGLAMTPSLGRALDTIAHRKLKRCRRRRTALRHAIRRFLRKSR